MVLHVGSPCWHLCPSRAECEDRLRAEFRIEMNAAVAESEQRWQGKEQELQSHISELQSEVNRQQSQVGVLPNAFHCHAHVSEGQQIFTLLVHS